MLVCPRCERMFPTNDHERCPDDGSLLYVLGQEGSTRREWTVGDHIAGKYLLISQLERKVGTGLSFKAEQIKLKRVVELRLLPSDGMMLPGDQARFEREVSTWALIRSPHIVRLYDYGFTEREEPYITLEYTSEGSLRGLLQRDQKLSYQQGALLSEHLLQALEVAHQAQVLHRNVNPDSVVLHTLADGSAHYRLTGFAVAKHIGDMDDDPTAITMTGQVICDPAYMAPEMIMMGILEPRTDLYALGVTLYEAFTGTRPFPGESLSELLNAHVRGTPTPIEIHRPDMPLQLKAFLNRLLAKEPQERFNSASDALMTLRQLNINYQQLDMQQAKVNQGATIQPLVLKRQGIWTRITERWKELFRKRKNRRKRRRRQKRRR